LYVAEDRKQESLDGFWGTLTDGQRKGIEADGRSLLFGRLDREVSDIMLVEGFR
jgi:hypothetical protein